MKCGQKLLAGVLAAVMTVYAGTGSGLGVIAAQDGLTGVMQVSPKAGDTASDYTSLQYTLYDDHAEITGCADTAITSATIPRIIDGVPVTMIGKDAFRDCSLLKTLIIPDSVTSIGNYAFAGTALTEVVIPDSVTSIGQSAFHSCQNLTDVTLSKGLTSIQMSTFSNCGITAVNIPEGVTSIEKWAFSSCSSLTEVSIPDSMTTIETQAFYNCDSLTRVVIPASVTNYSEYAFSGCDNLTEIVFGEQPATEDTTEPTETTQMSETTQTTVQTTVQTTATEETTTESVYVGAEVSSEEVPEYLNYADYGGYIKITGCDDSVTTVMIPAKIDGVPVTGIADRAFSHCYDLTQVSIPSTVTRIEQMAFYQCKSLRNVIIPDSVTYLGRYAFGYCESLTQLSLSRNIRTMGECTFCSCPALTGVTIPDGAVLIGDGMFWGCTGLTWINIPGSVTTIGNQTFRECSSLIEVNIPEGVKHIGNFAFYLCENLTVVTIPTTVTTFGTSPFYHSSGTLKVLVMKNGDPADAEILCITDSQCEVEIATLPDKTSYLIGESLDLTGMQVNITHKTIYNDTITMTQVTENADLSELTITGFDSVFEGIKTIAVSYPYYDYGIRKDTTFTATFNVVVTPSSSYQICYDANGGEMQLTSQTGYSGETITLSNEVPVREGYRFMGWAVSPSGEAKYQPGQSGTIGQDLTLYAVWTRVYTITYDANGGEGAPDTQSKPEGTYVTISDIIPVRDDYQFIGWSTTPDGAVEYNLGDLYSNDADLTLYAVWATFYYITYNANGGTGAPATQMKYHDLTQVLSSETPTRSGYTFKGWALRPNGHVVYTVKDYYDANAPVTLYAVWQEYCDSCSGSGQKTSKCPACDYTGMIEHYKSCDSCGGDGNITKTVTKTVEKDIPCLFCDETGTEISITLGPITCRTCGGKGYYTKIETATETVNQPCTRCSGDGELFSHETECTNSNCNNGWIVRTCTSCYGDLSTTATLSSTEMYSYFIEFEVPAFCFAHDTASNLVKSVTRYTFSADGELISGPDPLPDWSSITLKGTTPAEQFSGQSGLHDLVFECTDEYGTTEIPAAASAYIGVKGDANMDGTADAADAAAILVYAAECGASGSAVLYSDTEETMERFAYFLADVNGESTDGGTDSPLDAADAAAVLIYAAAQGSGSDVTWEELLGTT